MVKYVPIPAFRANQKVKDNSYHTGTPVGAEKVGYNCQSLEDHTVNHIGVIGLLWDVVI